MRLHDSSIATRVLMTWLCDTLVERRIIWGGEHKGANIGENQNSVNHKDLFLNSLERCNENGEFIPAFYHRFFSHSDEIRRKFSHTNFEKQNQMLLNSLRLAAGATAGEPQSLREIRERAITHDRDHLNIKPELYKIWLESVIETARDFDDLWDESVEVSWNTILGFVIKHMIKYY